MNQDLSVIKPEMPGVGGESFTIVIEDNWMTREIFGKELLIELKGFADGWEVAINKVLRKIQDMPLSPAQKKLVWKEVKSLK